MFKQLQTKLFRMKSLALLVAFTMLVSTITVSAHDDVIPSNETTGEVTTQSNVDDIALPAQASGGNILHAWNMSFNEIMRQLPYIAEAGFNTIQTSPIGESLYRFPYYDQWGNPTTATERSRVGTWWMLYQPTAFRIGNMLGTEAEFRALTAAAAEYGIGIIVDAVPNHTTSWWNEISEELRRPELFHSVPGDGSEWDRNISNWGNRAESRRARLLGLVDFYTGNPEFQELYKDFLGDIIDAGAIGFRYDAMVHIELPEPWDAPDIASDFWPNIQQFVDQRVEENGGIPFQYGEILDRWHADYIAALPGMAVTADQYGRTIRSILGSGNLGNDWRTSNFHINGATADRVVTWVESHDHYGNAGESRWINDAQMRVGWAIMTARAGTTPLFLVRPGENFVNDGRVFLSNGDGTYSNVVGHSDMFRDPTVAAVNWFSNYFIGQPEYLSSHHNQVALIERGPQEATTGVTIVNVSGNTHAVDFPVRMNDGQYTCQVTGNNYTVANGRITGPAILGREVLVIYGSEIRVTSPSVFADPGTSRFTAAEGVDVTLFARHTTSQTYTVTGPDGILADAIAFTNGEVITIGAGASYGDEFILSIVGIHADGEVRAEYTFTKGDPNSGTRIEFVGVNWDLVRIWGWHPGGGNIFSADWNNAPLMEWDDDVNAWVYLVDQDVATPFNVMFHNGQGQQLPTGPPYWLVHGSTRIEMVHGAPVFTPIAPIVTATPGSTSFYAEEGITITLGAINTTTRQFEVRGPGADTTWLTFEDGQEITIGVGANVGDVFTITLVGSNDRQETRQTFTYTRIAAPDEDEEIRIEFVHPTWNQVRIWAWVEGGGNLFLDGWSNAPLMEWDEEVDAWVHTFPADTARPIRVMFHNGQGQQTNPGFLLSESHRLTYVGGQLVQGEPILPLSHEVTFDATSNGGELMDESATTRMIRDMRTVGTLPEVEERDGFTFDGWFTQAIGGTRVDESFMITATITFYAQWTEIPGIVEPIRIEFTHANDALWSAPRLWGWFDGAGNLFPTLDWNTAPILSWCETTDAWVFILAAETPRPVNIMFHNGAGQQTSAVSIDGSVRLDFSTNSVFTRTEIPYSPFTPVEPTMFEVRFDAVTNGGALLDSLQVTRMVENLTAVGVLPEVEYRDGFDFLGWFTAAVGGTRINANRLITGDITFYAQWEDLSYVPQEIRIEFVHYNHDVWTQARIWGWFPGGAGNLFPHAQWTTAPEMIWDEAVEAWVYILPATTARPLHVMFHNGIETNNPTTQTQGFLIDGSSRIEIRLGGETVVTPILPEIPGTPELVSVWTSDDVRDLFIEMIHNHTRMITFDVLYTYCNGDTRIVTHTIETERNTSGSVNLGDYTVFYDIRGNGSNVRGFWVEMN